MANNVDPEMLYMRLGRLIESTPDFISGPITDEKRKWLGTASALVQVLGDKEETKDLRACIKSLMTFAGDAMWIDNNRRKANQIQIILNTALTIAELHAPVAVQESFIPAGAGFDAFAAISKVFGKPKKEILIIDPYLDATIFTDFAPAIPEGITTKLLASEINHARGILQPAFARWVGQHGDTRPTELRVASNRVLHDRMIIIDSAEVWILTQSFNAFAERSNASIVRSHEPELKIEAYTSIWNDAEVINP